MRQTRSSAVEPDPDSVIPVDPASRRRAVPSASDGDAERLGPAAGTGLALIPARRRARRTGATGPPQRRSHRCAGQRGSADRDRVGERERHFVEHAARRCRCRCKRVTVGDHRGVGRVGVAGEQFACGRSKRLGGRLRRPGERVDVGVGCRSARRGHRRRRSRHSVDSGRPSCERAEGDASREQHRSSVSGVTRGRSQRRRRRTRSEPRLVLRFVAITAVGLVAAGATILVIVNHSFAREAQRQANEHARFAVGSVLGPKLRPPTSDRTNGRATSATASPHVAGDTRVAPASPRRSTTERADHLHEHASSRRRRRSRTSVRQAITAKVVSRSR